MNRDLTKGSVLKSMLLFSIPMILGDFVYLNDIYNIYNPWFMYGKWSVVFN